VPYSGSEEDRAAQAEAKLATAVGALRFYAKRPGIASHALSEIEQGDTK